MPLTLSLVHLLLVINFETAGEGRAPAEPILLAFQQKGCKVKPIITSQASRSDGVAEHNG